MFPTDPRAAIARLPFLLDVAPQDTLLVAGFDADGRLQYQGDFPLGGKRPLDEPLLESSLWPDAVQFAVAVAYSELPGVDLRPLVDAWGYRGRTTIAAAWAGPAKWRSYLCEADGCCTQGPRHYTGYAPGHDRFDPLYDTTVPLAAWRRARWEDWRTAIALTLEHKPVAAMHCDVLSRSLHDIPVRDAVLAHSAGPETAAQWAIAELLQSISERSMLGCAIPAHTCLAAMQYLADELQPAHDLVSAILDVEEYSLARLLYNGLEMRAPASLLARSFAHFSPHELLAA